MFESVLKKWVGLEPIIQSEVSQKEKDKYHILSYIYTDSRRMVLKNLFTGQQWRNRQGEQTYGHGERGGEGEICMERITWKLTLPCVKQIANGNLIMAQETQTGPLYQPRGVE